MNWYYKPILRRMENVELFLLLALFAEILGTIGGFGSSLFFVPMASFFLEFHAVLGLTALFHVSSNLIKIAFFRAGIDKSLIIKMGIPSVIFVSIGAYLSKYFEGTALKLLLSIFLIVVSVLLYVFKRFKLSSNNTTIISSGVVSGFVAGLLGTGGAVRGAALSSFRLQSGVFIVTSAIIDLAIDSSRSVVYALNGYVYMNLLYLLPLLILVSILGTYIGKRILQHISEAQFKNIVLVLVGLTGLIGLYEYLF